MNNSTDILIKAKKVKLILGCDTKYLNKLIASNELKPVRKSGVHWWYSSIEVENYKESLKNQRDSNFIHNSMNFDNEETIKILRGEVRENAIKQRLQT